MVRPETDIETTFADEDDDEAFRGFAAKDIAAARANLNKLLKD